MKSPGLNLRSYCFEFVYRAFRKDFSFVPMAGGVLALADGFGNQKSGSPSTIPFET
jgi:hypothetical protein